jgi:hypothetical protein
VSRSGPVLTTLRNPLFFVSVCVEFVWCMGREHPYDNMCVLETRDKNEKQQPRGEEQTHTTEREPFQQQSLCVKRTKNIAQQLYPSLSVIIFFFKTHQAFTIRIKLA